LRRSWKSLKREKNEGNKLYASQDYERALKKYKKSLEFFQHDSDLKDEEKVKAKEIKVPCYLNTAVCLMRTKKFKEAIENCTKALEIEKDNVKALFRRGTCYSEVNEWEASKKDLNRALELEPENKDAKRELILLKNKIKDQNQKDKKIYAGMFEKLAQKDSKKLDKEEKKVEEITDNVQQPESSSNPPVEVNG